MNKDKRPLDQLSCPESVDYRSGCKVCWRYYATKEEAQLASRFARRQGERDAARGYDFGYCWPGSVDYIDPEKYPESKRAGLYEVCWP